MEEKLNKKELIINLINIGHQFSNIAYNCQNFTGKEENFKVRIIDALVDLQKQWDKYYSQYHEVTRNGRKTS